MNTAATKPTTAKNVPAFEVFFVEERPADRELARIKGKTLSENAVDVTWHKCGVAFISASENLAIFIGDKDDPAQRKCLAIPTSALEEAHQNPDAARSPVANVFLRDQDDNIDFENRDGVLFLNRDDSYSLVLGPPDASVRYVLLKVKPKQAKPSSNTEAAQAMAA
jgi:hypothetical protein